MSTATCRHGHDCHINAVQGTCMVSARLSRQVQQPQQQPAASNRRSRGCRRHPFHPGRCRRAVRETRADVSTQPRRRRRHSHQPLPIAKPAPCVPRCGENCWDLARVGANHAVKDAGRTERAKPLRCAVPPGIYWAAAVASERACLTFVLRFKWTLA